MENHSLAKGSVPNWVSLRADADDENSERSSVVVDQKKRAYFLWYENSLIFHCEEQSAWKYHFHLWISEIYIGIVWCASKENPTERNQTKHTNKCEFNHGENDHAEDYRAQNSLKVSEKIVLKKIVLNPSESGFCGNCMEGISFTKKKWKENCRKNDSQGNRRKRKSLR